MRQNIKEFNINLRELKNTLKIIFVKIKPFIDNGLLNYVNVLDSIVKNLLMLAILML